VTRISTRNRTALALVSAAALLVLHAVITISPGDIADWSPIRTPVDRSADPYDDIWLFLEQARQLIPSGAAYTIVGNDGNLEMRMFMISLGILTDHEAIPTRYYSRDLTRLAANAEYILAYGREMQDKSLILVAHIDGGSIYRRGSAPR